MSVYLWLHVVSISGSKLSAQHCVSLWRKSNKTVFKGSSLVYVRVHTCFIRYSHKDQLNLSLISRALMLLNHAFFDLGEMWVHAKNSSALQSYKCLINVISVRPFIMVTLIHFNSFTPLSVTCTFQTVLLVLFPNGFQRSVNLLFDSSFESFKCYATTTVVIDRAPGYTVDIYADRLYQGQRSYIIVFC